MNIANSQVQRRLRVLYTGSRSSKCHWVAKRVKKWLVLLNDHVQAVFIEKCEEEIFWQKYRCTILSGIKMYKMEMSASHGPPGAGTYSAYGQFEFFCLPEPWCLISGHRTYSRHLLARMWHPRHPFESPKEFWHYDMLSDPAPRGRVQHSIDIIAKSTANPNPNRNHKCSG